MGGAQGTVSPRSRVIPFKETLSRTCGLHRLRDCKTLPVLADFSGEAGLESRFLS